MADGAAALRRLRCYARALWDSRINLVFEISD